jgi:glycosyltransferase involved in cell wall biosynthesis
MANLSVIIPLFNKDNFITRAVQSVLAQEYQDFELIIVNDGSTDNSLSVVSSINDTRINIINKTNGGVSSARNAGVDASNNDWICFLDADDYWYPNHLKEICYLLNKYPEGKIYTTLTQEKSTKGFRTIPNAFPDNFEGYVENYFSFAKTATVFNSSSVCVNKKAILEIYKFDTNLTHGEDLDVWFKLLFRYRGVIKSTPTVVYDLISENRAMQSFSNLNTHLLSKINSYRSNEIYGLNDFIDYFILRNSVPYYFSKKRQDIIPIILTVKDRKKLSRIWTYLYADKIYTINLVFYKLYKKIVSILYFF